MQTPPVGNFVPGGGVVTSQSPSFTLPVRYMILGIFGFGLFAIDLVFQAIHFGSAGALLPSDVALTHLLTLGSLLAFVMGAVYQLSTVAFLIPISVVPLARLNFWLYVVSAAGLISSMAGWWIPGLILFGSLMTLSIYVYAVIIIVSVGKSKVRGAMQWFVLSAHAYLILAVTAALLLIIAMHWSAMSGVITELLLTHILLAVGGFFSFIIMGFSLKLLPMFTLSHGFSTWRQKWTLTFAHAAIWVLIAGVWTHWRPLLWLGGILGVVAFVFQLFDVSGIVKKRMRKKIEPPIRAVWTGAVAGGIGLILLLVQLNLSRQLAGWQSVVMFYLLGFVTLTIMGYAYKIVPFLIWSKRHSKQVSGEKRVLISDLINLRHAWPVFIGFAAGLIVLTASSVAMWPIGAVIGGILIAAAILIFCVQIFKVLNVKQVRKELTERD